MPQHWVISKIINNSSLIFNWVCWWFYVVLCNNLCCSCQLLSVEICVIEWQYDDTISSWTTHRLNLFSCNSCSFSFNFRVLMEMHTLSVTVLLTVLWCGYYQCFILPWIMIIWVIRVLDRCMISYHAANVQNEHT